LNNNLSQVTTYIISCCARIWNVVLILFVMQAESWVVLVEYSALYCDDGDVLSSV